MKKETKTKPVITWGVVTTDGTLVGSLSSRKEAREFRIPNEEKIVRLEISGNQVTSKFVR